MIPERYMVTAVPIDGGKRVKGYLAHAEFCNTNIPYIGYISWKPSDWFDVDPSTIEPVKVAPTYEVEDLGDGYSRTPVCPNCSHDLLYCDAPVNPRYCPFCGQALDWGI